MATITMVGRGPGPLGQLTKEAEAELLAADEIFFRTGAHPAYGWLEKQGKYVLCFDRLYDLPWKESDEVYEFIVSALFKEAELHGKVTCALLRHTDLDRRSTGLQNANPTDGIEGCGEGIR